MSDSMNMRSVGVEVFHTNRRRDRQTDMTKVIIALRNFVNAPEKHTKDKPRYKHYTERFIN